MHHHWKSIPAEQVNPQMTRKFIYGDKVMIAKLTFEDGSTTTWTKTRTSTLIEGADTAVHNDDVWSSTGTATGVNRNGKNFSATITEPLIKRASCRWISAGVIEFTVGARTRKLDYGNGDCDRLGELTLANGDTYTIHLRR